MRINFKYIILLAVPVFFTACTSLDEDPRSNEVSETYYSSEKSAESAVNAIYSALVTGGDQQTLYNRGMQVGAEISSDDYIAGPRAVNANVRALSNLTEDPSNDRMEALWSDSYRAINFANVAIDRITAIPEGDISEGKRNQYVNEAKFLRALLYFNLVRWFKYIPLILHETTSLSSDKLNVSQATEDEVYAQIIQDLKDAESLPNPKEQEKSDLGRATAGSAKALLAKVYLTRQDWADAASTAKEIIDSGWYDLFEDYNQVFDAAYKNGKEHIFSIQFKGYSGLSYVNMLASCEATYEVPGINGSYADAPNPNSNLYSSFRPEDKRLPVSYAWELVSPTNGKTYKLSAPVFNKYYDQNAVGSQYNSSRNIPLIRYSEVLLIYAEALNELNGPTPEAYQYIDRVRTRAGIPTLATIAPNLSKEEFRDSIFEERRKEFVYEYKRWFDLSRRGADFFIKEERAAGKTNAQPKHIHFPIPQRELDINPNLKQNPDWE